MFLYRQVGVTIVFPRMWVRSLFLQGHFDAGACGRGHGFSKSLESGRCFCTSVWRWDLFFCFFVFCHMWVWSLYLQVHMGVVTVSTEACGVVIVSGFAFFKGKGA